MTHALLRLPQRFSSEGETIMSKEDKPIDHPGSVNQLPEDYESPLGDSEQLLAQEIPPGVDRRTFMMRSAVIGAASVMTGRVVSARERTLKAFNESVPPQQPSTPPLDKNLNVVKKGQGPVMTVIDEFYKVGPGPSSSHTIGPMRITYDFYQRATK